MRSRECSSTTRRFFCDYHQRIYTLKWDEIKKYLHLNTLGFTVKKNKIKKSLSESHTSFRYQVKQRKNVNSFIFENLHRKKRKKQIPRFGECYTCFGYKTKTGVLRILVVFFFKIGLCSAIIQKVSARAFVDVAEHRSILKNYQSTYHPRFSFIPKTGSGFPKTEVLFVLWLMRPLIDIVVEDSHKITLFYFSDSKQVYRTTEKMV